jgi:hypothetical protein
MLDRRDLKNCGHLNFMHCECGSFVVESVNHINLLC